METDKEIFPKENEGKASKLSYLTGAYLFFFYMEASLRWPLFHAIRFHFVFGLVLTIVCLFKYLSNKQDNGKRILIKPKSGGKDLSQSLINTVILFIVVMGVYSVASMARDISMDVYFRRVIKLALISFFIVISVDKVKDLKIIVIFLLLAWLKISSEGFIGWVTGSLMWQNQGVQRLHGASPFVGHPNSFSAFAVGCLAFSLFLYQGVKSKWLKLMMLSMGVFSVIIIIFTASRSGYVAILLGSIYLYLKMKKGKVKIFIISVIMMVALAPIIPEQYYERFSSIYTGKTAEGNSSNTRTIIMTDALKIYAKYPLGIGIQAFSTVRMEMFGRFQNIHMLYLEVLTNLGPIGLIVFFTFIYRLMKLNRQNIKLSHRSDGNRFDVDKLMFLNALSKAVFFYLILRLIFGIFAMDLYEPHWWLMLGFIIAVNKLIPTCKIGVKS